VAASRTPPGPHGKEARAAISALRDDAPGVHATLARRYGDLVRLRVGLGDQYLVSGPAHAREVLVSRDAAFTRGPAYDDLQLVLGAQGLLTTEGDAHRRDRALVRPFLVGDRLHKYVPAITTAIRATTDRWSDGQQLDAFRELGVLTVAIVGAALLGVSLDASAIDGIRGSLLTGGDMFDPARSAPAVRRTAGFRRARSGLHSAAEDIMSVRRHREEAGDDLLGRLLAESDRNEAWVSDHVLTFLQAGSEPPAAGLTWTLDLLARHPEVQDEIHTELRDVLGDRPPTTDDLPRLPQLEKALTESMRLRPPVWAIPRRPIEDVELGRFLVPRGSHVVVSVFAMHHDPQWFDEPERYLPHRWDPGAKSDRPVHCFLPFGAGSRRCIGSGFASMAMMLVLATVLRDWQVTPVSAQPSGYGVRINLQPQGELPLVFTRRR
jgi:cytochrome P450